VATPIGNLRDISLRALDVFQQVDAVAAEDTRITARLLGHYGIARRLIPLHEHNERKAAKAVLDLLATGRSLALACDAGTPAISDPGALLVKAARDAGYAVTGVPGPNAAITALSTSGLPAPHFLFYGFLPQRTGERRRALAELAALPYAVIFHEAPHRLAASIADLRDVLGGEREVVIARELTKLYESVHRCRLADAPAWLAADPDRGRGEFVLIVEGAAPRTHDARESAHRTLAMLLEELPLKQAVSLAARLTGSRRNELYRMALEIRKEA
jgi:16S rRNA (cytidine1402-2'-O)-methyltransferase